MSKAVFDQTTFDASTFEEVGKLLGHRVRVIPITITLYSRDQTVRLYDRDLIVRMG